MEKQTQSSLKQHRTGMYIIEILYSHSEFQKFAIFSSKATIEVVHGLMGQVIKDQLFNSASTQ